MSFASFITGVRPQAAIAEQSSEGHRVYFANHNSHGDFILLWISLPYEVRKQTRPVAGKDYWTKRRNSSFSSLIKCLICYLLSVIAKIHKRQYDK